MSIQTVPDHVVPVAPRLPVGRLEFAGTPTRLYGIDRIGQVFVLEQLASRPQEPAVLRLVRAVVGL